MMFRAPLAYVVAAVIAFLAALHKILYASVLVNDDFMPTTIRSARATSLTTWRRQSTAPPPTATCDCRR